jgi:hypothetical protein
MDAVTKDLHRIGGRLRLLQLEKCDEAFGAFLNQTIAFRKIMMLPPQPMATKEEVRQDSTRCKLGESLSNLCWVKLSTLCESGARGLQRDDFSGLILRLLCRCQTRAQSLNFDRYQVLGALPTQDARHHAFSLVRLLHSVLHSIECELG